MYEISYAVYTDNRVFYTLTMLTGYPFLYNNVLGLQSPTMIVVVRY